MKTTFEDRAGRKLAETEQKLTIRMMDCVSIGGQTYFITAAECSRPFETQKVIVEGFPLPSPPIITLDRCP